MFSWTPNWLPKDGSLWWRSMSAKSLTVCLAGEGFALPMEMKPGLGWLPRSIPSVLIPSSLLKYILFHVYARDQQWKLNSSTEARRGRCRTPSIMSLPGSVYLSYEWATITLPTIVHKHLQFLFHWVAEEANGRQSGAWRKTRSGHRWYILSFYVPDKDQILWF